MIRAVVIDDEEAARELLTIELSEVADDVQVIERCATYEAGLEALKRSDFDIAFIDIIMPRGNGLDLLRSFPDRSFYPVIVTSHAEYAIEAIREEAFDYLLKPVDQQELKACLARYRTHEIKTSANQIKDVQSRSTRIEVKDKRTSLFIPTDEILYLEASGSYTTIYTEHDKFVESQNLKAVSSLLSDSLFFRCSHQHLVNLSKVKGFDHESLKAMLITGESLRVSVRRKSEFIRLLREL